MQVMLGDAPVHTIRTNHPAMTMKQAVAPIERHPDNVRRG
jgi:hypothetical protein